MRFIVAVLACALAVANAQFVGSPYRNNYNNFGFGNNQYRPSAGQYKPYQPINKAYPTKPYVSSTPFPVRPIPTVPPKVPVVAVAVPKVAADARSAETVKSGFEISPDGAYNYFYETNNGIAAQAQGTPRDFGGNPPVIPDVSQGSFSWFSPEGQNIAITYVADENGYQPEGAALPVPPAVPAQIARALEYAAAYRTRIGA